MEEYIACGPGRREFFGEVKEEVIVCIRSRKLASNAAMAQGYYYDTSCTCYPERLIGEYAKLHKLPVHYFRVVHGRNDYDEDFVKIPKSVWNLYLSSLFIEFLNKELEEYREEIAYQSSGHARLPPFYCHRGNIFYEEEK